MSGLSCSLHTIHLFTVFPIVCVREKEAVKPKTWNLNSRIRIGDGAHKILQNSSCLSSLTFWDYTNSFVRPVCAMTAQIKFYFVFSFCIFPRNMWFSLHNTTIILVSLRSENFLSTTNILNHFHVVYVCIYLCLCFAFYTFKYLANPCGQSSPKWLQDYSRLKKFLMVCPILWTYTWMLEIFTAHCTRKVCATETRLFCMTAIVNDA